MAQQKFTNNAVATLSASINSTATTVTVASGQGALFPTLSTGDYFYATIIDSSNNIEIVKVTARSTDSLTVVRAQESTTGRSFIGGDKISLRVTAAGLNNFAGQDKNNTFSGTNTFSGAVTFSSTTNFTGAATYSNLPTFTAGILPQANGGTGSATVTGSGLPVFATSPSLTTPRILGSSTGYTTIASSNAGTTNYTATLPAENFTVGFRNIPPVGTKTSAYTLTAGDVGKYVQVGTSGSIVIPDGVFSEGDVVSIFNNTSSAVTITCSITTAYISGVNADKASVSLTTRGVATILFISGTVCVISGLVS